MVYIVDHCNTQTVLVTCSCEARFHVIDELSHVIYFFKQLVAFFPVNESHHTEMYVELYTVPQIASPFSVGSIIALAVISRYHTVEKF